MQLVIAVDDPRRDDVRALLEAHLAFSQEVTPAVHVHALPVDDLLDPAVTCFTARASGELLGVGALRHLDDSHAELKSMHTAEPARGRGVGRALVEHLLVVAAERGYDRVSLETGASDAFLPARSLYASMGFTPCAPFGGYTSNPYSTCMSILVGPSVRARLQDALGAALRAGDRAAVNGCRSALAAIANAEAVDAANEPVIGDGSIAGARTGLGAGEAPRRELSARAVVDIVHTEIADRRTAADLYARHGETARADRLRVEAAVLAAIVSTARDADGG